MNTLTEKELSSIEGGVIKTSIGLVLGIGAAVSFAIGFLNGYLRPLSCSSKK